MFVFVLLAGLVFLLDQLTKYFVVLHLPYLDSIEVIPSILHLTHVRNVGAAFGLFAQQRWLFLFAFIALMAALVWLRYELMCLGTVAMVASGLIFGGALGNAIDRVRLGYVIDFLDFRIWPVFNIADSAIVLGAVMLGFCFIRADNK